MSFWTNIFFLLLGWFLGLVSTIFIEKINKNLRKKEIKTGVLNELKETKYRLAVLTYIINSKFEKIDKELLNWFRPLINKSGNKKMLTLLKPIEELLKLSNEQLNALSEYNKPNQLSALSLKKLYLPFLDSKISDLSLFDINFQRYLLEIKTQITFLNDTIELSNFYYQKTFDSSLNGDNYEIIDHNLKNTYMQISDTARIIVDLISEFIDES